jgi:hypothetical protein
LTPVSWELYLLIFSGEMVRELMITERRTKPLRGRKKDWCVAPFFLLNLVQFGVIVPSLLSFGNL